MSAWGPVAPPSQWPGCCSACLGWKAPFVPAGLLTRRPPRSGGVYGTSGIGGLLQPVSAHAPLGQAAWKAPAWAGAPLGHAVAFQAPVGAIEIYFSAGRRENWGVTQETPDGEEPAGPDGESYRSCDDGNDRNCDLWRVRWNLADGRAVGNPRKVRGKADFLLTEVQPIALTRPAVSPSGDFLAYGVEVSDTDDVFRRSGDRAVLAMRTSADGIREPWTDTGIADPEDWGGGVSWPAFLGDDQVLTGHEMFLAPDDEFPEPGSGMRWDGDYSAIFKDVLTTPVEVEGDVLNPTARPTPVRGPRVYYDASGEKWPTARRVSDEIQDYGVATDPHAHEHVLYDGVDRGARVVAYGEQHRDEGEPAVPVVFDPVVAATDVDGTDVDEVELPAVIGSGGCHHPTWNITGDLFQCSHQQSTVPVGSGGLLTRRTLHGFAWSPPDTRWVAWDGGGGELFPSGLSPADRIAWFDVLAANVVANSDRLGVVLPSEITSADPPEAQKSNLYIWKYGAFCGSDDFVVAQFACSNEEWARAEFDVAGRDPGSTAYVTGGHFGQLISRVVLIRLSDGYHWDLTAVVADYLGLTESATDHTANIFGIYPTCAPPPSRPPLWAGGSVLHLEGDDDAN